MTNKEKIFEYRMTVARLQGSIEGIITNLELSNPNVKSQVERLKAALKRSEESIKPLEKPNKITIFN